MKGKNSTNPLKRERRRNKYFYFMFYDHSASENCNPIEDMGRDPAVIQFCAWLVNETEIEYVVEVVRCTLLGNSNVWHIIKSAVIEKREVML